MNQTACSYLGLADDPETHLAFPSERNCCVRARPIGPVNLEHQSATCLSADYIHCPMLAAKRNVPLPKELRYTLPAANRYRLGMFLAGVLILIVFGLALWRGGSLVQSAAPSPMYLPNDNAVTPSPTRHVTVQVAIPNLMSGADSSPTPSQTPVPTIENINPTETIEIQPTLELVSTSTYPSYPTDTETSCSPPAGWMIYIVQPNDSLFHIGLAYGTSVNELQIANCMGDSVTIYTGQKLYVPNVPTFTPPAKPSQTPTGIVFEPTLESTQPADTPIPNPTETSLPSNTPRPADTETQAPTTELSTQLPDASPTPPQ